jgi:hypothetical protein
MPALAKPAAFIDLDYSEFAFTLTAQDVATTGSGETFNGSCLPDGAGMTQALGYLSVGLAIDIIPIATNVFLSVARCHDQVKYILAKPVVTDVPSGSQHPVSDGESHGNAVVHEPVVGLCTIRRACADTVAALTDVLALIAARPNRVLPHVALLNYPSMVPLRYGSSISEPLPFDHDDFMCGARKALRALTLFAHAASRFILVTREPSAAHHAVTSTRFVITTAPEHVYCTGCDQWIRRGNRCFTSDTGIFQCLACQAKRR